VLPAELATRGPSRIAGRGLLAAAPIAAGTVVLEQDGVGELNHSCEPNLGWASASALAALRDIGPGEELTLDYATVISDPDFVLMCHCETYRCRQVIEGTDWQIPQLQKRYAGSWAPHVQHLIDESTLA
jgi:SET domain-containing protein